MSRRERRRTNDENADEGFQIANSIADRSHDDAIVGEMGHRTNGTKYDEQVNNTSDRPDRRRCATRITFHFPSNTSQSLVDARLNHYSAVRPS